MVVNNATGHINTMTGVFCFQHNFNVESVKGQKKNTANTKFVTQRVFLLLCWKWWSMRQITAWRHEKWARVLSKLFKSISYGILGTFHPATDTAIAIVIKFGTSSHTSKHLQIIRKLKTHSHFTLLQPAHLFFQHLLSFNNKTIIFFLSFFSATYAQKKN